MIATMILILALAGYVIWVIRRMVRRARNGQFCNCDCSGCSGCGHCSRKEENSR